MGDGRLQEAVSRFQRVGLNLNQQLRVDEGANLISVERENKNENESETTAVFDDTIKQGFWWDPHKQQHRRLRRPTFVGLVSYGTPCTCAYRYYQMNHDRPLVRFVVYWGEFFFVVESVILTMMRVAAGLMLLKTLQCSAITFSAFLISVTYMRVRTTLSSEHPACQTAKRDEHKRLENTANRWLRR